MGKRIYQGLVVYTGTMQITAWQVHSIGVKRFQPGSWLSGRLALGRGNVSFSPLLIKTASSGQRLKAGSCNNRHSVLYQLRRLLPICSGTSLGQGKPSAIFSSPDGRPLGPHKDPDQIDRSRYDLSMLGPTAIASSYMLVHTRALVGQDLVPVLKRAAILFDKIFLDIKGLGTPGGHLEDLFINIIRRKLRAA